MRRAPVQGRHRNRFVVWRVAAASFAMHGCEAAGWPTPFQCPLNVLVLTVGLLKVFGRMLLATDVCPPGGETDHGASDWHRRRSTGASAYADEAWRPVAASFRRNAGMSARRLRPDFPSPC